MTFVFINNIFVLIYNLTHRKVITSKVWTNDSRLLQESNVCRNAATGRHITSYRRLQMKDLPKVSSWRLEVESNKRPSAPKQLGRRSSSSG